TTNLICSPAHNDGREVDLLALNGTLPVVIRGVTYNIPVCVWLQEKHPYVPPLVFVRPTSTMAIKASQHVDTNGRVYHPFLHEWNYLYFFSFFYFSFLFIYFSTMLFFPQADVDNDIKLLTQKNEEISEVVTKLEANSDNLNIDEAVVTTAPLYNQSAFRMVAPYAGDGHKFGSLSHCCYCFLLQHVRTLSRKQFMLRALLYKARKTAGLKEVAG
ncbi:tumor susceptibility gene 101 protein-like, partial [Orbicella faveolata]|uniref:tumor susceptibility gene 101 protein-like n=1 Tax=Orbicella faveolata TaxID=48498 RepID=UPI0009E23DF0